MLAELEGYQDQLLSIRQDVPGLVAGLSHARFHWRPALNRWSIGECFEHLNVTARAFMPAIDAAIADGRHRKLESQGPFTYSLFERLVLRLNDTPPKMRFRAPRALRPTADRQPSAVLAEFMNWQDQLAERLRSAEGLDLRQARGRAPAFRLFRWSLGSLFAVTLAHERRHIWQARQVRNDPRFPN